MAFNTGTVPLTQALPWSDDDDDSTDSCIVVTDSVETDGRFLLYTLASQALAGSTTAATSNKTPGTTSSASVLWLACGPITETLVATALRKMGCDAALSYLKMQSNDCSNNGTSEWKRPLAIHSILTDLSKNDALDVFDEETYLKNLYDRIQKWCQYGCLVEDNAPSSDTSKRIIIVDDVSSLANSFGDRLVYFFLHYLRQSLGSSSQLIVRCSNDMDRDAYSKQEEGGEAGVHANQNKVDDWVGAGGRSKQSSVERIPWERNVVELLADWVVDVVPLASGYSREAHGRLVYTHVSSALPPAVPVVMNYCLQDTSVSAIRLRR
jgi:hypothetical protein